MSTVAIFGLILAVVWCATSCQSKVSQDSPTVSQGGVRDRHEQSPPTAPRTPLALRVDPQCKAPSAIQCIQSYAFGSLTPKDIERLVAEGIQKCFPSRKPDDLAGYQSCLPIDVGTDTRNKQMLSLRFICGDECPDQGWVFPVYGAVKRRKCCSSGGRPYHHVSWRAGYVGCVPPEEPLPRGENPCDKIDESQNVPEGRGCVCPPGDPLCSCN